jgi:tetraacyldisaccharide 4'-kinase
VAIFCAIASPEGFEQFIVSLGANIVYKKCYIDHHRFTNAELSSMNERAKNVDFLITTEKDVVRIANDFKFNIPFFYMRVRVQFLNNEHWIQHLLGEVLAL